MNNQKLYLEKLADEFLSAKSYVPADVFDLFFPKKFTAIDKSDVHEKWAIIDHLSTDKQDIKGSLDAGNALFDFKPSVPLNPEWFENRTVLKSYEHVEHIVPWTGLPIDEPEILENKSLLQDLFPYLSESELTKEKIFSVWDSGPPVDWFKKITVVKIDCQASFEAWLQNELEILANKGNLLLEPSTSILSELGLNSPSFDFMDNLWFHNSGLEFELLDLVDIYPILLFMVVGNILAMIILGASVFIAVQKPDTEKLSIYECGFDPYEDSRNKFDIRFYIIAILFIIFDLETVFCFPWILSLGVSDPFSVWVMMDFLLELIVGFAYVWCIGALVWE